MHVRIRALVGGVMLGASAATTGCHSRAMSPNSAKLAVTFNAPSEVQVGDSALLHLVVTNVADADIRLSLWTGGGLAFDPFVLRFGDGEVWRRSGSSVVLGAAHDVRLRRGDSLTFVAIWPTADQMGRRVGPGSYIVTALLKDASGRSIIGTDHKVTVRIRQ
jgi:hypothetical protein